MSAELPDRRPQLLLPPVHPEPLQQLHPVVHPQIFQLHLGSRPREPVEIRDPLPCRHHAEPGVARRQPLA